MFEELSPEELENPIDFAESTQLDGYQGHDLDGGDWDDDLYV